MVDEFFTDPLGRQIVLHDRTWYGHILKGHPDVEDYRDHVSEAITSPELIRISRSDPDCRLYYGSGPSEGVRMVVVADVSEGVVKTAHLVKKVTGGDSEWPS